MKKNYKYSKKIISLSLMILPLAYMAQIDSVFYHDNSFETQYGAGGASPSADYMKFETRFTPPYYPAQLTGIKVWLRNAGNPSTVCGAYCMDPAGSATGPGSLTQHLTATVYNNPASGGVADSSYSLFIDLSANNVIIPAGDVYAGVTQHMSLNGFAGAAIDQNASAVANRQWINYGGWYTMASYCFINGNWACTAYFAPVSIGVNDKTSSAINFEIYPQPATDNATVTYNLPSNSDISIRMFDVLGKEIKTITSNENQFEGMHSIVLNTDELKNGIYFCTIQTTTSKISRKLVVIKNK